MKDSLVANVKAAGIIVAACIFAGVVLACNVFIVLLVMTSAGWFTPGLFSLLAVVGAGALLAVAQLFFVARYVGYKHPKQAKAMAAYIHAHRIRIILVIFCVLFGLRLLSFLIFGV